MAMTWRQSLDRLAPDLSGTLARFPVAGTLTALATAVFLASINEFVPRSEQTWMRLWFGLGTGAVLAVAGKLFAESRPEARTTAIVLRVALPLLAIGLWQIRSTQWTVPFALPVIALLFLSVSPVLRIGTRDERRGLEDRFWWINHRAITTGVVAGAALAIVALGVLAIERSLDLLFGLRTAELFYQWVLPVAAMLLAPVYWLSTIPKPSDFAESDLTEPDFLSRAIGFLGQFVLTPLLLIYALILLAYGIQIVATRSFPVGVIGWLVLTFVVTGAANWLVLHPEFMRGRPPVSLFRRTWFWLTIIPIVLYALAVFIRIDAYGLTNERMALVAGGLWAGLLTLSFLIPRGGDIRLIPGLAAAVLLVFGFGPWNFDQLPRLDQMSRLRAALQAADAGWSTAGAQSARSAIDYLTRSDDGQEMLAGLVAGAGLELDAEPDDATAIARLFEIPAAAAPERPGQRGRLVRADGPIDLSGTPILVARVQFGDYKVTVQPGLDLSLRDGDLVVSAGEPDETTVPLAGWLSGQAGEEITDPVIRFEHVGRAYVLVAEEVGLSARDGAGERITFIDGSLFTDLKP